VITEGNTHGGYRQIRGGQRKISVRHVVMAGMMPLTLAAAASVTVSAQAATPQPPLPGVRLMWATPTAMQLGWPASRTASSYSYQLDQMNGRQVRTGAEPGSYDTVTFRGLHPGWRYRGTVSGSPAYGPGQFATLYVMLPRPVPPREYAYQWAETQAGAPYLYGAEGHGGYDCSGLVRTAYRHAGIWLPRTTGQMLTDPLLQRESSPRQGDLVFFGSGHVELYDRQDWSFGAESGSDDQHAGSWWYRWWTDNWWPTAFYRVVGAG
jgi:cell wall-associated NlpC family hydrolase